MQVTDRHNPLREGVCSALEETDFSVPGMSATPGSEVLAFVANMNEIVFITDTNRNILVVSSLAREVFAIPEDTNGLVIEEYIPKVYVDAIYRRVNDDDMKCMRLSFPVKAAQGNEVMLETRFNWFRQNGEKLLAVICRDINEITRTMLDLAEREDRYKTIFHASPIGFIHVNSDGFITDCNTSFFEIFGLDEFDINGICLAEDNNLDVYPKFKKAAMDAVVGFSSLHESRFSTRNGEKEGWVRVSFNPMISENKAFLGAIGIVEDITKAKDASDRISYVSSHDALTGLYNRHMCVEAIKDFERRECLPVGVIYADLNCLKLANDAFGHPEGDTLLKTTAQILKDNAGEKGEVYRLGGDEFIILIEGTGSEYLEECMNRITKTCRNWKGEGLISPSIALGSAIKSLASQDLEAVIKEAEDTMYANKMKNGKPTRMRMIGSLEGRLHNLNDGSIGDRTKRIISWAEWFIENVDFECDRDILRLLCRYYDVGLVAHPEEIPLIDGDPRRAKVAEPMQHMAVGYRIAKCTTEIANLAEYILSHHEWWDGMGYPNQQGGDEIPRESMIVSVLDCLEGMVSQYGYGNAGIAETIAALEGCAGRQFNPALVEHTVRIIRNEPPKLLSNMES